MGFTENKKCENEAFYRVNTNVSRVFFLMAWLGISKEEAIKKVSEDK